MAKKVATDQTGVASTKSSNVETIGKLQFKIITEAKTYLTNYLKSQQQLQISKIK